MQTYTVSEALYYLKTILELDELLSDIWLQGEVSGVKRLASGHYYFRLKDGNSAVDCALFKNAASRQICKPEDGGLFVMRGYFSIYEDRGQLQFYVQELKPKGVGGLSLEFEALKRRLAEEGLFAQERKRPLPERPKVIGVVTSATAAAFQDILNVLRRRYPLAQVVLSPTLVQGENAPPQIVSAIQALNRRNDIDVMIVARGGGSIEELWCFNDERVARAIFASRIPVVTGVGHEIDTTIVDFVADLRAPTPSAAAEIVTPNIEDLRAEVLGLQDELYSLMENQLDEKRNDLNERQRRLKQASPAGQLPTYRQRLDELTSRAGRSLNHRLELEHTKVHALSGRLKVLDPHQILVRGYAIITQANGQVLTSVSQALPGETLNVRVSDGQFKVERL
ncbi:MAG: exodeoxyribonuclease VII large subunit [Chloroflexota bacterium]